MGDKESEHIMQSISNSIEMHFRCSKFYFTLTWNNKFSSTSKYFLIGPIVFTISDLLSLYHRTSEWLRLAGPSEDHLLWPSPKAGCPGPCPCGFWRSPRRRSHSLSAACTRAANPTERKCCLVFRGTLLCSSFCPWTLVLAWVPVKKSLTSSCLHPPFRNL